MNMDYQNDSNKNSEEEEEQVDLGIDLAPLTDRYEKVLTLNNQTRQQVDDLTRKAIFKPILNQHIDFNNKALPFNCTIMRQNIEFQNFMTKRKNQSKKKEAFQIMRQMLEEKGLSNISTISARQPRSVMVVRFVNKIDNHNIMEIQDDVSKDREKIVVKNGIVYIGLICAIEAVYENQMYKLEKIIDLNSEQSNRSVHQQVILNHPPTAYRMLVTKGPFWKTNGKDNAGILMIVNELESLRYKHGIRVNLLIVMGPILSQHNQHVKNCTIDNSFEDESTQIIETLKTRVEKVQPGIEILIMPSTDDVISFYPIPQPVYDLNVKNIVKLGSNPCTLNLSTSRTECKINLINYDLITYIDESKCGRSIKQPLIQNIETYLKQPFYLTNTLDDTPFDETNFSSLFNRGQFGDLIVMSSQRHPVFAHRVKGNKVFVNVGSLGVDWHAEDKHFMTLISLYDGLGDVSERIKVDAIIM